MRTRAARMTIAAAALVAARRRPGPGRADHGRPRLLPGHGPDPGEAHRRRLRAERRLPRARRRRRRRIGHGRRRGHREVRADGSGAAGRGNRRQRRRLPRRGQAGRRPRPRRTSARRACFGDFNPGNGNPATLKVRFSAFGFGIDRAPGAAAPRGLRPLREPQGQGRPGRSRSARARARAARSAARRSASCSRSRRATGAGRFSSTPARRYVKGTARSRFPWDRLTLTIELTGRGGAQPVTVIWISGLRPL